MNSRQTPAIVNNYSQAEISHICADLVAVCGRTFAGLDFRSMLTAAMDAGYEPTRPHQRDLLRMSMPMEVLYEYFQQRTDWVALGEILDHAGVPFTVNKHVSTDRHLDPKTETFTMNADRSPHTGDFSFGTVGGFPIRTVIGSTPKSDFAASHPTLQIELATRIYLTENSTRSQPSRFVFRDSTGEHLKEPSIARSARLVASTVS